MIQDAKNRPVSELFDVDSKVVYVVPKYQREYTWTKAQWEALFDDLEENDPGYFLGSLICINQSKDSLDIQKLEVVDGQQRMTTLSLFFAAIFAALKKRDIDLDEDQRLDLANLKRKLVLKGGNDQIRFVPQTQNHNLSDYKAVLAENNMIGACDAPPYAGNRKIFRAYRYFRERIEEIENGTEGLSAVLKMLDKLNRACLVKIEVANHADAYTLFESLNNRGMPLTAIDLIKNKLLARLESIEPGKVADYFEHWNRLLGYLGDDNTVQERFFRHFYNAFRDDLKGIGQVPLATRSNLIRVYEKLINNDAKECLRRISEAGKFYSLILSRNQDDPLNGLEKPFKSLERIQGAPSYLLMLYLLVKKEELKLHSDDLVKITNLLIRFFVRRNLTDIPPTRDLTRMFMTLIDRLQGFAGSDVVDAVRRQLMAVSATDALFRQKLEGPIYEENSGVARFILCALAEEGMTKETEVDLWRFENKQFLWTIEHVFPQGENIPEPWIDMVSNGDKERAKEIQETHVHKLGNLTISGFNSALGNKRFEEKRDRTDRKGHFVGYRNGLKLNEDLAHADHWDADSIDARTLKLVEEAMVLFSLKESDDIS